MSIKVEVVVAGKRCVLYSQGAIIVARKLLDYTDTFLSFCFSFPAVLTEIKEKMLNRKLF